jgi:hypothetical protein
VVVILVAERMMMIIMVVMMTIMIMVMMTVMATEGRTRKSRAGCVTCPEDSRLWGGCIGVFCQQSSTDLLSVCAQWSHCVNTYHVVMWYRLHY